MKPPEVVIQITFTYHYFFMKFQVSSYFAVFVGKVIQCPKLASVDILLYLMTSRNLVKYITFFQRGSYRRRLTLHIIRAPQKSLLFAG